MKKIIVILIKIASKIEVKVLTFIEIGEKIQMKYLELVEKLQKENDKYVVLIQSGIFFIAIGKDAQLLNKKIGLKLTCMKKGLCKVRISNKKS